ncbi:MAG: encapsulin-associated ferritin-like protein [Halanaerobiales bacterium]
MANEGFHEEGLSQEVKDFHRMIQSLIEELEAIDWYHQRAAATADSTVRAIVEHNRDEEVEHAMMALEWLRRRYPVFDEMMREFLFTEGDITELEEGEEGESGSVRNDGSLGLSGLKGGK